MSGIAALAVTMGDPAGIGGELTLRAWQSLRDGPCFYAIDCPKRLRSLARQIAANVPVEIIDHPAQAREVFGNALPVIAETLPTPAIHGKPIAENAPRVIASIERAVADAMSGRAAGVVTQPINKHALIEGANFPHPGHTEFLAALAGSARSVMMLAAPGTPGLRVVPVTIHIALEHVPAELTQDAIVDTARITHAALQRDFGIAQPRLAIAGLNPHAGEQGMLGAQDAAVIAPAVQQLRDEGIEATGPLPADTMFHAEARARYDVALCMYHDQALIPVKMLDFHRGVNVTLGLPFVRTSPDHGTAYNIAGQGIANPTSFIAALELAAEMSARRNGKPS